MLGYRLGFALAAVIAALFAVIGWQLVSTNRLTPTTSLLTETSAVDPLTIEIPSASIYQSDTPGDAGALYRAAAADVRANSASAGAVDYAALMSDTSPDAIEAAPAVAKLIQAGPLAGGIIFADAPAAIVSYEPAYDDIESLAVAGNCLGRAALLRLENEPNRARPLFEAQFVLGAKLFAERLRYAEATAGLTLERDAVAGLREIATRAGDTRRAALLSTFDRSAAGLAARRIDPLWSAIGTLDGNVIADHAGDVFALSGRDNKERLWRIEAILALGRHRFNVERAADQLIVPRRLAELEKGETDTAVLAAIKAARELTIEQFRSAR